jgi:glycosyltransferase involved in cell wall biosynthesis
LKSADAKTSKRYVYIHFPYFKDRQSSMGAYCFDLYGAFTDAGYITILCAFSPAELPIRQLNVPPYLRGAPKYLKAVILMMLVCLSVLRRGARYVVIINPSQEFVVPVFLSRSLCIIHDTIQSDFPRSRFIRRYMKIMWFLIQRAAKKVSISATTQKCASRYGVSSDIIRYQFDLRMLRGLSASCRREKIIDAVWCGTMAPHKNIDLLIELAAANATRSFMVILPSHEIKLWEWRSPPPNMSVRCGLSTDEYMNLLGDARILISTSLYEGFGRPPMEALMVGTQALVSDINVYREIYGGLARFHDNTLAGLNRAFQEALSDPNPALPSAEYILARMEPISRYVDAVAELYPRHDDDGKEHKA